MLYRALHSNTSHVLIYQLNRSDISFTREFKYISCSYLSAKNAVCKEKGKSFKYISCSYLSLLCRIYIFQHFIQIHLMFLFIHTGHFTHVVIFFIQIHLMFLFILHQCEHIPRHKPIQIHLMFLFIYRSW